MARLAAGTVVRTGNRSLYITGKRPLPKRGKRLGDADQNADQPLSLRVPLEQMIATQQADNGLQLWAISLPHITALSTLPLYHNDPFDRLLIAQAKAEGAMLVSADAALAQYEVPIIW